MNTQIFKYENMDNLTTLEIDGEIWFVANEVCKVLDIKNSRQAVTRLDDDEKGVSLLPTSSGNQNKTIVSESGLYSLIFTSNKPEAKQFRKWVTKEVIPSIRKKGVYIAGSHKFVVRFNDNWDRTDKGYFSVISELYIRLYGRFWGVGHEIAEKAFDGKEIRPDNSVGKLFAKYLRDEHPEISEDYKKYLHIFPNGFETEVRQYKNSLLPLFIEYVDDDWMPNRAQKYFKDRDPVALEYLPKLLEV